MYIDPHGRTSAVSGSDNLSDNPRTSSLIDETGRNLADIRPFPIAIFSIDNHPRFSFLFCFIFLFFFFVPSFVITVLNKSVLLN